MASLLLPSRIPTVLDLLPPLVLGASEFLLFGVLAHQATGLTHTASVVEAWFFSFAGFCLCSVAACMRADHLFKRGKFRKNVVPAICEIRKVLRRDAASAAGIALVGVLGGIVTANRGLLTTLLFVLAGAINGGLSLALIGHAQRVRAVQAAVAVRTPRRRPGQRPVARGGRRPW